jgi:hypothetical protein
MLNKVTAKAYHALSVLDTLGIAHDIKVLNFTASGTRTMRLDRQCIADTNTLITEGMQLMLPDGKTLIVSYKQADIYQNLLIRYTLDCIEATHSVDIIRSVLTKSAKGGLASKDDTVVYESIAVKIGTTNVSENNVLDVSLPKYVMYLSTDYLLQAGDRIVIADTTFEVAKVDSFIHITPGLMEIRFDKDPRWL